MKFEWKKGLILLPLDVEYERQKVHARHCVLDTGSASTVIDINLVKFNFQKPGKIRRLRGIGGGIQEVVIQKAEKLTLGKTELCNFDLEFGDILEDLGFDGIIGIDLLKEFILTVDFPKQDFNLQPS